MGRARVRIRTPNYGEALQADCIDQRRALHHHVLGERGQLHAVVPRQALGDALDLGTLAGWSGFRSGVVRVLLESSVSQGGEGPTCK
jgi:hypothetical protein